MTETVASRTPGSPTPPPRTAPAPDATAGAQGTGRVVVTGIGVASPNGLDPEKYWTALLEGHEGIRTIEAFDTSRYPCRLAGLIPDFDDAAHIPGRLLPQTDRVTRLALYAAERAIDDAALGPDDVPEYDMGVVMSNASGGHEFTHREFRKLWSQGPQFVSVYESFAWFYACNTGQISIRHQMRGPSAALVGEQAGGLDAVGHARRAARRGTRLLITGGADSAFDPWGWISHLSGGWVSRADRPEHAFRPFDAAADGHVPGEGGAVLVLEEEHLALERGAPRRYGSIAGYAATFDPPPGSPRPRGLARAARLAIADAGLTPEEIDVVFADSSGVPEHDRAEAEAIGAVFGPHGVPVTAPKALIGRLYAGGPPLDLVAALLAIRDGLIPPTAHTVDVPDEYGIDLVRGEPRRQPVRRALVLARGRCGFNSAMVVRAMDDEAPHGAR
ncbi:ketosynthase chain-length factor [Allostreptomyces psammosilenae]|uniref:Act minimal PKS chain-length factor (CLF/KS beta) n=1 Tax=Allostreptomyces psammosilenae TaxID=1892865 RepID=A0A853A1A3_9ACTN|nr:ketosynthase chain-length factor [Allostreptomyces psammosilenae]NYI04188.1 act minimal PKS chain-length factor (CLF/KS beta) [Allostreptomyces psammosilenae]